MNKQIKELLDRATIEAMYETQDAVELMDKSIARQQRELQLEKFALLIIRECMACSIWVGKNNTNTVEPIHTAQAINQRIKQQFGVEE
jgi:hypothetical protein